MTLIAPMLYCKHVIYASRLVIRYLHIYYSQTASCKFVNQYLHMPYIIMYMVWYCMVLYGGRFFALQTTSRKR